ncbi:hypothetical protein AAC387_Pa10g0385 [Persea americana]
MMKIHPLTPVQPKRPGRKWCEEGDDGARSSGWAISALNIYRLIVALCMLNGLGSRYLVIQELLHMALACNLNLQACC